MRHDDKLDGARGIATAVFITAVVVILCLLALRCFGSPGELDDAVTVNFEFVIAPAGTAVAMSCGPPVFCANTTIPECYVCSADTCTPGLRIEFFLFGALTHGVWLLNNQIGLPDGSIISDSCLPRWAQ